MSNPLEDAFGITPGSTPGTFAEPQNAPTNARDTALIDPTTGTVIERKSTDVTVQEVEHEERLEDLHIDQQLETIHDHALTAFESQHRLSQECDPKFSARNAEVAAQYLNIALNSINSRVDTKYKRNKIRLEKQEAGTPNTVNNNVIVADRNELVRMFLQQKEKEVPGEVIAPKPE